MLLKYLLLTILKKKHRRIFIDFTKKNLSNKEFLDLRKKVKLCWTATIKQNAIGISLKSLFRQWNLAFFSIPLTETILGLVSDEHGEYFIKMLHFKAIP